MRHSAENQRRYKQHKKETDANYLQREMQRVAKYYVPTSQLSSADAEERRRRVCLCKIHQNFHLRLAPLKPFGVPQSATNFLELYQTKESVESELAKLPIEDVQFRMWKQTTQMHKGKSVKRTTLFDEVESKEVFHNNFSTILTYSKPTMTVS